MGNNLIKIETLDNGIQAVSAKELYNFLSNDGTHFARWAKQNITDNDFADIDKDYAVLATVATTSKGGQVGQDYALTLDFAKELCMLSKCDKGKQAREYFISVEKQYKLLQAVQPVDSYMIQDPVERAQKWIEEEQQRQALAAQIEELQPAANYANNVLLASSLMTTTEIAADYGLSAIMLNNVLAELNVQYKCGKRWYLYSQYQGKGYTQSKTALYDSGAKTKTSMQWTQTGREFIYKKLHKIGIAPVCSHEDEA